MLLNGQLDTEAKINDFRTKAKEVLAKPVPEAMIKERDGGGGRMLSYVDGAYVTRVLNLAFDNIWSWEPVDFRIIESQPKVTTSYWDKTKKKRVTLDTPQIDPQPPVCHVCGKLTVPGFGTRFGFGSQVLVGGASEQESCFKSASTDALKVAAKSFGIALDLYEETPFSMDEEVEEAQVSRGNSDKYTAQRDPEPAEAEELDEDADFKKLRELSGKLGITSSEGLNPYIREFSQGTINDYAGLPSNKLKVFLVYLAKKVAEIVNE